MHLAPREIEKLMLHNAGFLAQKRLARGVRLNYPESIALIATQILEFIRDGRSVDSAAVSVTSMPSRPTGLAMTSAPSVPRTVSA